MGRLYPLKWGRWLLDRYAFLYFIVQRSGRGQFFHPSSPFPRNSPLTPIVDLDSDRIATVYFPADSRIVDPLQADVLIPLETPCRPGNPAAASWSSHQIGLMFTPGS